MEDNKKDCAAALEKALKGCGNIRIQLLKTKYPQGAERMLIYAVTGRKINSSMLPADVGCIVDNVETAAAVYRAVALGEPVMDRTMTVSGDGAAKPEITSFLRECCSGKCWKKPGEPRGNLRK